MFCVGSGWWFLHLLCITFSIARCVSCMSHDIQGTVLCPISLSAISSSINNPEECQQTRFELATLQFWYPCKKLWCLPLQRIIRNFFNISISSAIVSGYLKSDSKWLSLFISFTSVTILRKSGGYSKKDAITFSILAKSYTQFHYTAYCVLGTFYRVFHERHHRYRLVLGQW